LAGYTRQANPEQAEAVRLAKAFVYIALAGRYLNRSREIGQPDRAAGRLA
jgi:hypothetical protein